VASLQTAHSMLDTRSKKPARDVCVRPSIAIRALWRRVQVTNFVTQMGSQQKDDANEWSKNYGAEGQFWEVAFKLYERKRGS
jgi:hypothetical protein